MMKKLSKHLKVISVSSIFILSILFPEVIDAQVNNKNTDSLRLITIDEIVITANRYDNELLSSGAAVSVIRAREIQNLPAQNFSGILEYIPGLYSSSTDGMGLNPQVSVRGFYGGGEAEYLTVLIDGIPVNDLETGLANWNQIPIGQIQKVELLRGGASTMYGNAAMGGVLNIRTKKDNNNFTTANLSYGSFNSYGIGASHGGMVGKGNYEIYLNNNATDGYREHSNWNSINFGGKVKLPLSKNSTLTFGTYNQILNSEDPGFLSETQITEDRKQSQAYFREDGKDYQKYLATLQFNTKINSQADLSVNLNYQYNSKEQKRTYGQYPTILIQSGQGFYPNGIYDTTVFGNTKKRNLTTDQANMAIRVTSTIPEIYAKINGGIEVDYGGYSNEYYDIFRGFENDYANNYFPWDSLDTKGDGYRFNSAAYLNGEIDLARPLKLIAGVRYDLISDEFNGKVPDTAINKSNSALSPKIALSLTTGNNNDYKGSIYMSYSHAFKAPTIDQRTDLKHLHYFVFIEAGPAYYPMMIKANPFSNADLKPQTSVNYEIGTYQYYRFSDAVSGEISIAAYLINVNDEIDFDLATQQYKNIVNTEHTGVEISMRLNVRTNWSGFINYNYCNVKFSNGENKDKRLTGIPDNVYATGISYSPAKGFGATLLLNGASGIYLDEENTQTLSGYSVVNTRIDYKFKFATIYFDVNNLFDSSYNSTGYMISGEKYLYPAMGRFIRAGVNLSF